MVLPAAMVDCCLASLRAGVCSPPWRWRISAWVLMVACLPLLRGRRSAPSPIPWPILDLTLVLSRCKNLALLVSWRLMSVPGFRHCHPGCASSFFRPFLRSAGGDGLHSSRCMELNWFSFPSSTGLALRAWLSQR